VDVHPGDVLGDALEARQRVLQLATRAPVQIAEPRHTWTFCVVLGSEEKRKDVNISVKMKTRLFRTGLVDARESEMMC